MVLGKLWDRKAKPTENLDGEVLTREVEIDNELGELLDPIAPPELTFPDMVTEQLRREYENADVILEYGSGGSTVMASQMPGKTIYSVESDRAWCDKMTAFFTQNKPSSRPFLHYVDIGPTKDWGMPKDHSGFRSYHKYPLSIWDEPDFKAPDVVLVDGRFRVACALTTLLRTTKDTVLLFDDYKSRKAYHMVENFITLDRMIGPMGRFKIRPGGVSPHDLTRVIGAFARPF